MSSPTLSPNPCLVAILLVCQTRSGTGPQLVYSWPPDPLSDASLSLHSPTDTFRDNDDDDDDSSDDSEGWSSDDSPFRAKNLPGDEYTASAIRQNDKSSDSQPTTILGLEEDGLVGLLAPDRSWNKRKFELNINDLTFIGRPVFARQDGSWSKVKKAKSKVTQDGLDASEFDQSTEDDEVKVQASRTETQGARAKPGQQRSELNMFHAVFVMNPPPLEHSQRVKDMYDHVAKKLSKALKWAQSHHDWVWKETEALLTTRLSSEHEDETVNSPRVPNIQESSVLAKALNHVYTAISSSRIASVVLGPGVTVPLQIPPITSTSYLPSLTEQSLLPGLWLTTATEATSNQESRQTVSSTTQLAKSYTLLLKSPPSRIIKDAKEAGGPIANHIPQFIAALKPTKSFYKLSTEHKIQIADVQFLAQHLIFYRRAIAIPPLNQRDTYIISPNADFSKLREACKSYETQFPASLPTLPKLLGFLSGIPRPYGTLIPSPDHKDTYMLLLAWLMRNGWVTQLRTFAYVRVDEEMKRRARERDRESRASVSASQSFASSSDLGKQFKDRDGTTARPSFLSRQSSDSRQSTKDPKSTKGTSLIKSPPRASLEESHWLNTIHESILAGEGIFANLSVDERQELHHFWPTLSKHFDGSMALETVPIREGLKRKLVWNLYGKLGLNFDRGVEDENGENSGVMLHVRHW